MKHRNPTEDRLGEPNLAVFGNGQSRVAMDVRCLDEKAFVGLLFLQRAAWGTAPALSTATG